MLTRRRSLLAAALLASAPFAVHAQATQQSSAALIDPAVALSDSAVRALIKDRVDHRGSSGIVVGVLDPDGRRRVFSYGASGTARPLDEKSVFEIGSITKTFTGSVLADLVARGAVSLDDPVAKYLPAGSVVPGRAGKQITLVDLATQSSGLPRMPTNFAPKDPANPYADYTPAQALAFVAGYTLPRDIGVQYEYSNLGMGLLGIALANREGVDYETLVRRHLLDPLGMNDTRVALTPSMRERLALGHDPAGTVVSSWDIPGLAGAGALRSTVADMLLYLASNVDTARAPLGHAFAVAHEKRRPAGSPAMQIGLAWHVLHTPFGSDVVWHNGGTGGYRTFIGFDPARRAGVVVLSDMATSVDDIGFHLVEPRLPLKPPAPPDGGRVAVTLAPAVLDRYVGEYELAPTFHIVVTRDGTSMYAQATDQPRFEIFAEKEDEFFLKAVDAQMTFTRDASGAVTGVVLHQGGQHSPGRKIRQGVERM